MDMLNRRVVHKRFGTGVIRSCENGTMQVYFDQYGARFFHYPEIFDSFLSTDDEALRLQVAADLAIWRAGSAARDEQLAKALENAVREARTAKKPAPRRRMTQKKQDRE